MHQLTKVGISLLFTVLSFMPGEVFAVTGPPPPEIVVKCTIQDPLVLEGWPEAIITNDMLRVRYEWDVPPKKRQSLLPPPVEKLIQEFNHVCIEDVSDIEPILSDKILLWINRSREVTFETYTAAREEILLAESKNWDQCYYRGYERRGNWLIIGGYASKKTFCRDQLPLHLTLAIMVAVLGLIAWFFIINLKRIRHGIIAAEPNPRGTANYSRYVKIAVKLQLLYFVLFSILWVAAWSGLLLISEFVQGIAAIIVFMSPIFIIAVNVLALAEIRRRRERGRGLAIALLIVNFLVILFLLYVFLLLLFTPMAYLKNIPYHKLT